MIPKTIHYCWFGGKPLPSLAQKCLSSWKQIFPDFEIREWNESNFDLEQNDYVKFCYSHKLWAFLSDYVRLAVIYEYGGLYFDTDVEALRFPSEIISFSAWFGFESKNYINTGLGFAAEPHHPSVRAMLEVYESRSILFLDEDFKRRGHLTGCPKLNTEALIPFGLVTNGYRQTVLGAEILPIDYLCPFNDITGQLKKTENTISIHWFSKSPHSKMSKLRSRFSRPLHRIIDLINSFNKKSFQIKSLFNNNGKN